MTVWDVKYTDDQREAIETAGIDRGTRPAAIVALARAGDLRTGAGGRLEPFDVPRATVQTIIRNARRRRAGDVIAPEAALSARDAVEVLRTRMVNAISAEISRIERRHKATGKEGSELAQLAKAVRELAAIPGPDGKAPHGTGPSEAREVTPRTRATTTHSPLGRAMLSQHTRRSNGTVQPDTTPQPTPTTNGQTDPV